MLIPKRPDPLGANATLQHTVIGSTSLAASYTAFASSYAQRLHPSQSISRTAIFIRSSARLGLWAGALGAAVNWYYYKAFIGVVASEKKLDIGPRKLYDWTPRLTVDDGALAGAALGLAASIPMLFMRRPAIPQWTRFLGMTNIGACAGVLGAHGCLQYTGERQKAYKRLEPRLKQKSLEFWGIFWDKELMAQFDPLVQHYVRHNGIWHASNLPFDAYNQSVEDVNTLDSTIAASSTEAPIQAEQQLQLVAYYTPPFDYAEDLARISVESTLAKMAELEAKKQALLKEAEYLLFANAQKAYNYCHGKDMADDERQQRKQEIHILEIAYNRLRADANAIDIKLIKWRLSLQHKAILNTYPAANDSLESWLPTSTTMKYKTHDPTMSIQEMEKFQSQIAAEVKIFENYMMESGHPPQEYERCRKDLEDGRVLLRAVDKVVWELEMARKGVDGKKRSERANMEGEKSLEIKKVDGGVVVRAANVQKTGEKDTKQGKVV